jgi:hypothetical protein
MFVRHVIRSIRRSNPPRRQFVSIDKCKLQAMQTQCRQLPRNCMNCFYQAWTHEKADFFTRGLLIWLSGMPIAFIGSIPSSVRFAQKEADCLPCQIFFGTRRSLFLAATWPSLPFFFCQLRSDSTLYDDYY